MNAKESPQTTFIKRGKGGKNTKKKDVEQANHTDIGPDVITGGPFGPEGGLAATIVLLTSSILVLLASQREKRTLRMEEVRE